jgi:preprotein translocase subunit SecG
MVKNDGTKAYASAAGEQAMLDVIMIALIVIFFILSFWYLKFCERI